MPPSRSSRNNYVGLVGNSKESLALLCGMLPPLVSKKSSAPSVDGRSTNFEKLGGRVKREEKKPFPGTSEVRETRLGSNMVDFYELHKREEMIILVDFFSIFTSIQIPFVHLSITDYAV